MADDWCDGILDLDPSAALDVSTKALPAKWAIYLMCDAANRPIQLLSVKNLRASVRRRLSENPVGVSSKRVDYRAVVRRICWKRVDSTFEADLAYLDIAREVFPTSYRNIVTLRPAWWLHIDPDAGFPRWTKTDDVTPRPGILLGPLAEKGQAQKLVETIEDLFDLCRYHNVLVQSPNGPPCPYKDMGKCPAPCDGSVSMQQYKALIRWSVATLTDPSPEAIDQAERMKSAAGELKFELAGRIKQFIDGLKSLRSAERRFVRPIDRFAYLSVQPGPSLGQAKAFACGPGGVEPALCLLGRPPEMPPVSVPTGPMDAERLAIVTQHLLAGKSGTFIPADQLSPTSLWAAYQSASRQMDETPEDEGVLREAAVATAVPGDSV
jgi:hypothetical protein